MQFHKDAVVRNIKGDKIGHIDRIVIDPQFLVSAGRAFPSHYRSLPAIEGDHPCCLSGIFHLTKAV